MSSPYSQFSTRVTPQSEAIPGSAQVANSAGGYSFQIDKWEAAKRFLILGSEGGTYYIGERELTKGNALSIMACAHEDGPRLVKLIVEVSEDGRAPKNDPAIFALALTSAVGNEETRRAAFAAVPRVCRIGTHLFHFAGYREQFAGWGRGAKRAVASWYEDMSVGELAYQAVKYRQRNGWSHRDLLRLSHPKSDDPHKDALYSHITGKNSKVLLLPSMIEGFRLCQNSASVDHTAEYIREYGLPREAVPTEHLNDPIVWDALLEKMPYTAMIRNLGNMSKVGLLKPMSEASSLIASRLVSGDALRRARVHPLALLLAQATYASGHGFRGSGSWTPVPQVLDALNEAFYLSFGNVEPSNKRTLIGLDVSGSMDFTKVAGTNISCREAAAAMCLVTASVEPKYGIFAFSDGVHILPISPGMRMDNVMSMTKGLPFDGTDCALPMLVALQENWEVDTFIVYTDSETWAGRIHPTQALQQYRRASGINSKLIVVGMASNQFSIADPSDVGMLDVVGFSSSAPQVMSDFSKGL
jgi:60 kDa SS-A/Ro ribonucleoprotein